MKGGARKPKLIVIVFSRRRFGETAIAFSNNDYGYSQVLSHSTAAMQAMCTKVWLQESITTTAVGEEENDYGMLSSETNFYLLSFQDLKLKG